MTTQYGVPASVPITRIEPTMAAITPVVLAAGTTNDYAPVDAVSAVGFYDVQIVRLTPDAGGSSLSGLSTSQVLDGQYVILLNLGAGTVTLLHESALSALANRFVLPNAADLAIASGASVMLSYSVAELRWRVVGGTGGGAGAAQDVLVTDHGAIGNGIADDRAGIQTAVNYAIANGRDLFFPPGTYKSVGYIDVNGARNLRIKGTNGSQIVFSSDDVSIVADAIALSNNHARSALYLRQCSDVEISDLTFVGGNAQNITTVNLGNAISARHCVGVTVRRCTARGGYSLLAQDQTLDTAGTGDSLTVASGVVTVDDSAAAFSPGHVGRKLTIAGATNAANNGTFTITTYVSASSVKYAHADAISETSSFRWSVDDGDRGTHIEGCRSESQRGAINPCSDTVIRDCAIERPLNVDATGLGDLLEFDGATTVTLTDAEARFLPSHHGKYITIAGATAANNVTRQLTYISSTRVSFTNAAGVTEYFQGTWWIANGDKVGVGAGVNGLIFAAGEVTVKASAASFTANDVGKCMRINGATTAANNGAYPISTYVSPTEVKVVNPAGVSEAYSGMWTVDAFDRHVLGGDTIGSTHGIYVFAGRSNVLVDGCTFRGIRTTCVKASGSALPIRGITVRNSNAYECGEFFNGGADDNQEHTGFLVEGNKLIDVGTSTPGRSSLLGIAILGARDVRILNNEFYYTRNSIGAVDGRTTAGHFGIQAAGASAGTSQPLDDITIEGNTFTMNPQSVTNGNLLNTAISVTACGLRAKYRTGGTLYKSGSVMTLTDASGQFTAQDIGKYIRIANAPDAGNNGDFTITSVPSANTLTFTNAGGAGTIGTPVAAGTYAISRSQGLTFTQSYNGTCRIARNNIHGVAGTSIATINCVAPLIANNSISNGLITTSGDAMPCIVDNQQIATSTDSAIIRIYDGTSWPMIARNTVATRNVGVSAGNDMLIGNSAGTAVDYPLLGFRGRAVPTQAKPEFVIAYGSGHIDGDYIIVNGSTFKYKASAPGAAEFNSFADLVAKIDALANITCVDYGSPWGITTQHLKIAWDVASAVADQFTVEAYSINQTALVILYNHTRANYQGKSRGEGSGGPTADKTVVWSPIAPYAGAPVLYPDNAAAATLLATPARPVKNLLNAGACEVMIHGVSAGTEQLRWSIP